MLFYCNTLALFVSFAGVAQELQAVGEGSNFLDLLVTKAEHFEVWLSWCSVSLVREELHLNLVRN